MSSATLFKHSQRALAERVRALRRAQGLSQEALAHAAEIDRTYASQIERGVGNPSLRVLCDVATALRVDLVDLLLPIARGGPTDIEDQVLRATQKFRVVAGQADVKHRSE